jgi:hypothetical protein
MAIGHLRFFRFIRESWPKPHLHALTPACAMPDTPPAIAPQPSSGRLLWPSILFVAAAVLAAAWFLGDIPHRYQASQAMREGRVALLASDLPKALGHFRTAALLRPTDEAIIQQYDQTQTRWVEMMEKKLGALDATGAYGALHALPATDVLLVEPHLGRWRERVTAVEAAAKGAADELLARAQEQTAAGEFVEAYATLKSAEPLRGVAPELAARLKEVQDAQVAHAVAATQAAIGEKRFADARDVWKSVAALGAGNEEYRKLGPAIDEAEARTELQAAGEALQKNDFKAATAALERAAATKALADEVKAGQTAVRERAVAVAARELAVALAKNDEPGVTAALAKGHEFGGWESAPAGPLLRPADLPSFLKTLDSFGLGPVAQAKFLDRLDVPLVLFTAAKFSPAEVDSFARENLLAWSRQLADRKFYGLAVYLDEEARNFGAAADEDWRRDKLAQILEQSNVAIAVAPPAAGTDVPAGLGDAMNAAFRKALQQKLGAWPKLVEYDPAKPVTVVFRGGYGGYSEYDDDYSHVTTKTVRYESGTQQLPNREVQEAVEEHNSLMARYNQVDAALAEKEDYVARVNGNPYASDWDRSQIVYKQIEIASDRRLLSEWRSQLNEYRTRAKSLPQTVAEPVYDDEKYKVVDHVISCSISWNLEANLRGEDVSAARWQASAEFRTQEVRGNARHGVPVRAADKVPKAKLMPGLVKDLVKQVGNVDDVLKQLPGMTQQAFANFYAEKGAQPIDQANGHLSLLYAWESVGRKLDDRPNVIQYARNILNLPSAKQPAGKKG